jgi:hypothetical protein
MLTQSVSPHTTYRIEFFVNNPDPAGGLPEGQSFLGSTNVTTNSSGKASFSVTFNANVHSGQILTATATNLTTDPSSQAGNTFTTFNTSEFSPGLTIPFPPPPAPPPTPPPTLQVPPLLAFLNTLFGGIEAVNNNGTETITDRILGIPFLESTFDSQGNLTSVVLFGFNVTFLFG